MIYSLYLRKLGALTVMIIILNNCSLYAYNCEIHCVTRNNKRILFLGDVHIQDSVEESQIQMVTSACQRRFNHTGRQVPLFFELHDLTKINNPWLRLVNKKSEEFNSWRSLLSTSFIRPQLIECRLVRDQAIAYGSILFAPILEEIQTMSARYTASLPNMVSLYKNRLGTILDKKLHQHIELRLQEKNVSQQQPDEWLWHYADTFFSCLGLTLDALHKEYLHGFMIMNALSKIPALTAYVTSALQEVQNSLPSFWSAYAMVPFSSPARCQQASQTLWHGKQFEQLLNVKTNRLFDLQLLSKLLELLNHEDDIVVLVGAEHAREMANLFDMLGFNKKSAYGKPNYYADSKGPIDNSLLFRMIFSAKYNT